MSSRFLIPLAMPVLLALGSPALAGAASTPYSELGFAQAVLGEHTHGSFDQLSLGNAEGSVTLKPAGSIELGTLRFAAAPACEPCTATPGYIDTFSFTLGGVSETVALNYRWSSDGLTDTLSFSPISTLLFQLDGQLLAVQFDELDPLSARAGKPVTESLEARISPVPEPSPYISLAAGVLAMLGVARRRSSR